MKMILISAGHTNIKGLDQGAAGNGFIEGVEAVKLRDATAAYLRELNKDIKVIEDGFDNDNQPLTKAIALAKTANFAIEFHFNAGPPAATGIEVLSKPNKKTFSQKIAGAIHNATDLVLRGESGWKADNSGQHHRLGFCEAGGVIVEVGFISNASDMKAYKSNFEAICKGIAEVLANL